MVYSISAGAYTPIPGVRITVFLRGPEEAATAQIEEDPVAEPAAARKGHTGLVADFYNGIVLPVTVGTAGKFNLVILRKGGRIGKNGGVNIAHAPVQDGFTFGISKSVGGLGGFDAGL